MRARRRRTALGDHLDRRFELARRRLAEVHVQVAREARDEHLTLGVAEPHVVLEHLRSVGREHEPAEQHAAERAPRRASSAHRGDRVRIDRVDDNRVGNERHRRVRAHAARVRALRRCRTRACGPALRPTTPRRVPSQSANTESSGPVSPSSMTHVRPGVAERGTRQIRAHRIARLGERLGHDDALAGRETVGLDHVEPGERVEKRERGVVVARAERRVARGRDARRDAARPSSTPSSLRASRRGPADRTPGPEASTASTTPATSGSSGPTTTRSASSLSARSRDRHRIGRRRPADIHRSAPYRGCRARR